MQKVKEELARDLNMDSLFSLDTIVVDTSVPSNMPKLVEQTRCVATTVGPYQLYGSSVVEFCAKFGTHYVDITGELNWVKVMASKWQETAKSTGAKLISCCGHDSIPWDLSVMKLNELLVKQCDDELASATFWDETVGGAPGGTFATIVATVEQTVRLPEIEKNPFEDGSKSSFKANLPLVISKAHSPWDEPSSKRWTSPFVMAYVNAEVVRWSHALRSSRAHHSQPLVYRESIVNKSFSQAFVTWMGFNIFGSMLLNPVTRYFLKRFVIPLSGPGPSVSDMENKHYLCVYGEGLGAKGNRVESIMYFPKDAGCMETARMLAEAGLCLGQQEADLPQEFGGGGFFTPSTALGDVLTKRLVATGTTLACRVVPGKVKSQ
jgi:short subunit dehydrogenase-like uncharacterized protein